MAEALRAGYREVFERNERAYDMPKDKFRNLIVEMTGLQAGDQMITAIVGTFNNLRSYARFDAGGVVEPKPTEKSLVVESTVPEQTRQSATGFNLSYTINLNLPETADVEVFNAIFKSLKEHLLKA
jgi:hypothetical protein